VRLINNLLFYFAYYSVVDITLVLLYNRVESLTMETGNQQKVGAVIVAAGSSQRLGVADKVFA